MMKRKDLLGEVQFWIDCPLMRMLRFRKETFDMFNDMLRDFGIDYDTTDKGKEYYYCTRQIFRELKQRFKCLDIYELSDEYFSYLMVNR